ncbi:putative rRNA and tRNA processing protein [Echria macrotheca]|uniref:Ribonuclease P protein subunit n=1 Tax=Echria macrotheca TaxID=438768 RepID=A0AAJ0BJA0_9PEZI|nr:putative rRNA and tRNA processing protein [Echria macrotheca]
MFHEDEPVGKSLLSKAFGQDETNRIYTEKVQQRQLFLRASSPSPGDERRARWRTRAKKKDLLRHVLKPKPFSAAERKKLGLYDVPRGQRKYAVFERLNNLWEQYMHELLGDEIYVGGEAAAAKLCGADFHGASVEVVRSACVSRVGISGIVIKDSKYAFEVITIGNQVKLVPKEKTVFQFDISPEAQPDSDDPDKSDPIPMIVELHGEQFQYRPADRATKKFRSHLSEFI